MRLVVITGTAFRPDEAEVIATLLGEGIDRVHLRKPGAAERDMRRLIEALPAGLYPQLTLHDALPLAAEYGLGGVHLNRRNPEAPHGFRGLVSRSCHTLDELAACRTEDYLFLSPLFDSISKSGYRAAFSAAQLREAAARGLLGSRVLALGGVTPERLPQVREYGFGGAALLGCIWRDTSHEGLRRTLSALHGYANENE